MREHDDLDDGARRRRHGTDLALFDSTVYGRQEHWENSPAGWPKPPEVESSWRKNGRPTAQWPRIEAGRSDDLSTRP